MIIPTYTPVELCAIFSNLLFLTMNDHSLDALEFPARCLSFLCLILTKLTVNASVSLPPCDLQQDHGDDFQRQPDDGAQIDEQDHDAPFNIADLPQQLGTVDPHQQGDVHLALYQQHLHCEQEYLNKFNSIRAQTVTLSKLTNLHNNSQTRAAVSLLKTCHRLSVDDRYTVQINHPDVAPCVGPHYLDYTMYIGDRRGLDAALPNVIIDHNWTAMLTLNMTNRLWPDKNTKALPFDPKGRMMYIGTRLDDQFWLAMVPNGFFLVDDPDNVRERLPVLDATTTALAVCHSQMIVMFIAHVLSTMRLEDINCTDRYPDPLTWESMKNSTEIL